MPPLIDVHQHIWTQPLVDALAARQRPPLVRRDRGLTIIYASGEQPSVIDENGEAPTRRAKLLGADGLNLAIVAPSSPIGMEALSRSESEPLIAAYLEGVSALPAQFLYWGALALEGAEPADVDELLSGGAVGVSLPAGALAGRRSLDATGALLERAGERGVPVFVHPGAGDRSPGVTPGEPSWWPALTDYVAQMHAAWLTFAVYGRSVHPKLSVVFAMLAGGAPLLAERLATRGGPQPDLRDPLTFYDTSSYGPAAIEVMGQIVGWRQLVYGSDRPVLDPRRLFGSPDAGRERFLRQNAGRLLEHSTAGQDRRAAVNLAL